MVIVAQTTSPVVAAGVTVGVVWVVVAAPSNCEFSTSRVVVPLYSRMTPTLAALTELVAIICSVPSETLYRIRMLRALPPPTAALVSGVNPEIVTVALALVAIHATRRLPAVATELSVMLSALLPDKFPGFSWPRVIAILRRHQRVIRRCNGFHL